MTTVATLDTVMRLNSTAFRSGMVQAAAQANKSLTSIQAQAGKTASVLLGLKRAAETFGSFYLVKEGLGSLIEAQKQLQSIHYSLISATGSSTQAADAMDYLRTESEKLGLNLPIVAEEFSKLSAAATASGVPMAEQKDLFDAFAKASTTLHLSADRSGRALLALQEMFSRGTIQSRQLNQQLGQAIPGSAARFKNAVMEMVKGTDLQGKSFEQLIKGGELVTTQFMPALVTALRGAGSGWATAATALNANLNRVQTAWFNLKNEVSSGLFTDAATAGAGLLADNLSRVATLVTLIGAGGLTRIAGGAANTGASKVTRLQQEYQGTRMAAAAEAAYAEKIAATAATEQAAAAAQKEMLVARQANGAQLIAQNQAIQFEAQAQAESAIALKAKQLALNEASRSAIVMEAAEERLALAITAATEAQARVNAEMALGTGISTRLTMAQGRLAAAETAVAAAQARVAETKAAEAALGGLAATAGRAAKSFGSFALGLVGGPWGLAIAAIAGVSYAIYKVNKDWEDYLAEADKVAKGNEEVTQSLKDMATAYANVATRPDAGALKLGLDSAGKAAADARKELDNLIAKRAELQDQQERMAARGNGTGSLLDPKIGELDAKIAHARSTLDDLTGAASQAQMELVAELTPAILNSANPALDFLATKVYGARDAFDALHNLASLPSMFSDFVPQAIAASKSLDAYIKETNASSAAGLKLIQTHGKSSEGLALVRYNLLKGSEAYKAYTQDQKDLAEKQYQIDAAIGRGDDALAAKHTKVARASSTVADAYASMKNAQEGQLATLRGQLAGTDGYSDAQKTLNKMLAGGTGEFRKMSAAQQANLIATQKQIVADQNAYDLLVLKIDGARKLADLDRENANEQADRARQNAAAVEGVGHGSQWNAERQAIDEVTAATQKKLEAQRTAYNQQIDLATKANKTDAERKQIDENNLQMIGKIVAGGAVAAQQTQDQFAAMKAAQADWANGLQAGIENFQTQQQNNAAAAQKMVEDLTSGFSNAFVDFVDGTKSAKDAFGSLIDDMYKKALAFLADKAIQAFFDSFSQTGGGSKSSTPGSSAGGWGSLIGNFANALFGSGGKAEGGPVAPGSVHQVAERGPEVLQVGGKSYLLMGAQGGNVIPNHQLGGAGKGSVTYVTNVNVQPTSTRRTADQTAEAMARAQRLATTRNG